MVFFFFNFNLLLSQATQSDPTPTKETRSNSFPNSKPKPLSNEAVYNQNSLAIAIPYAEQSNISKLEGLVTNEIKAKILTDSLGKGTKIEFYLEEIRYEPLGKGNFARFLQGSVNLVDSVERPQEWTFSDTLTGKELKGVRKTKVEQLKGKNPRFLGKIIVPLVAISASVGAVIALFYVRSQ